MRYIWIVRIVVLAAALAALLGHARFAGLSSGA